MSEIPTEDELRRREYEMKRNDLLLRLSEAYHERIFKVTTAALAGNIGALALFATAFKSDTDKVLLDSLKASARLFLIGALIALLAIAAGWAMSIRRTEAFERIISNNFPIDDDIYKDKRNEISRFISYVLMPFMAVLGALAAGVFFVSGLLVVLTRAGG